MAIIEAIVFVAAAGFGLVVVVSVAAIIGISQEERRHTMTSTCAPTALAGLTRRVVGRYVRSERQGRSCSHGSESLHHHGRPGSGYRR